VPIFVVSLRSLRSLRLCVEMLGLEFDLYVEILERVIPAQAGIQKQAFNFE
jgi:hypothetical protein